MHIFLLAQLIALARPFKYIKVKRKITYIDDNGTVYTNDCLHQLEAFFTAWKDEICEFIELFTSDIDVTFRTVGLLNNEICHLMDLGESIARLFDKCKILTLEFFMLKLFLIDRFYDLDIKYLIQEYYAYNNVTDLKLEYTRVCGQIAGLLRGSGEVQLLRDISVLWNSRPKGLTHVGCVDAQVRNILKSKRVEFLDPKKDSFVLFYLICKIGNFNDIVCQDLFKRIKIYYENI